MSRRPSRNTTQRASQLNTWKKFLLVLNSSWTRYSALIALIAAVFKAGCYYEEGRQAHAHLEYDRQREDYWREQTLQWHTERKDLLNQIYLLREQNIQLLSRGVDSIPVIKTSTDERK